jgi:EAL domain-containing protein (putative c-di-GMP-specific phosphodiesterase class I)/DNA-binding response OmpR family regulator
MDEEMMTGASVVPVLRAPSGGGPILVVDDDAQIRRLWARGLERAGFAVIQAANGREALECLVTDPVALVLLDSQMPVMGGLETLAAIRRSESGGTLPVIMVTGLTEIDERVAGLAVGADDYVTKPVAVEEIVARVRSHMRACSAWNDVVERGLAERRAMAQALREARTELTPEQTAQKMLDHLAGALQVASLACLRFTRGGVAVPLAVRGSLASVSSPGVPIPATRSALLIERSTTGPWLESRRASAVDDTYAARVRDAGMQRMAYAPLRHRGELIGVLVAATAESGSGLADDDLARQLPALMAFAELAGALLGPQLMADDRTADARAAIESIIASRAFSPVFQPIVSLATGRPVAYEALTRFDDGLRPDLRFTEADEMGLGGALEETCVAEAIEHARELPAGVWLSVNASPRFLLDGRALSGLVAGAGRPVVIELTEHLPIHDYAEIRAAIAALGSEVRFAVDDTGAGENTLQHIVELGPDFVKVDISLVRSVDTNPARRAIIRALTYFAEEVGPRLVAEGIETRGELDTLRGIGVHMGQGYLLGRPRSLAVPTA